MLKKYSAYILCFLIALFVVALYSNNFSPIQSLEWKIQDLMFSLKGDSDRTSEIILVNIDERALAEYGEWPWPRDKIADLVAAVGNGNPRTVFLDITFDDDLDEDTAGHTRILAGQMSWMNNVILPYEFSRADFMTSKVSMPDYLKYSAMQVNSEVGILDENSTLLAQNIFLPPELLCQYATGLGFKRDIFDKDKKVRWAPMALYYQGYYYPSEALIAAAHFMGIAPELVTLYENEKIDLGRSQIPIDEHGRMLINYNTPNKTFTSISAVDILSEKYNLAGLKARLVIIGKSADQISFAYNTPVADNLPAVEKTANIIENIVHSNYLKRYDNIPLMDVMILIVLGGLFAFILPRVALMYRLIILAGSIIVVANAGFILFNSLDILTRSTYIILELVLLMIATPFLDHAFLSQFSSLRIGIETTDSNRKSSRAENPKTKVVNESTPHETAGVKRDEATVAMSPLKPPGSRDKYAPEETALNNDQHKPSQEGLPEDHSARDIKDDSAGIIAPEPMQSQASSNNNQSTDDEPWVHDSSAIKLEDERTDIPPSDTSDNEKAETIEPEPISKEPSDSKPISSADDDSGPLSDSQQIGADTGKIPFQRLGRYEVISVLGKGAMGKVYKGRDPAIDRNVALKTIRLDFVNDPEELEELKERLNREAKAAGMLSHPNIVTIYDVGAEGNLQYIAMEYLEGRTLEEMIRKKTKFNYRIIAQIITQICTALDYAHSQGIVHRDIKPANIMVLSDWRVKVMDFGIARVDSSSMTRTGIAMGTPNYISPEQLQGKPVDRRCDIFSLGVVMYEMLLQRRPFRGENLTSLIYNIVNGDPDLPSKINPTIPHLFDRVITRALKKEPDERFQHASEISASLSDFIESFGPKRTV